MTYQVLARKWRPQDFSSIVGQDPIVTALRNALTEQRIAQAYLFSGIRGVGKTTAARVLAKALNCEMGPAADPCNVCLPCREITANSDIDVIEIDAATYSKVEQVRELTESLRYGPARDRYKVVVLDEVHRLSRQAFDALLKIVEEPPRHLVFIFATTEIDAVPATILSRCQEFQFRRVPALPLTRHLREICDAEKITASDAALRLIARAGEGSVRDAVALLDQLATFGNGTISDQDAKNLLGGLDVGLFHRLLAAVLASDGPGLLAVIAELEQHGADPANAFGQFLVYCRDALHLALGGKPENLDLPLEDAEELARLAVPVGYENLLRLLQLLLHSEPGVRRSEFAMLALEIALLRAAELPKLTRVEELLAGTAGAVNRPATPSAPSPAPPRHGPLQRPAAPSGPAAPAPPARDATTPARDATTSPRAATPAATPSGGDERLPQFLDLLSARRQSLAAHFRHAELHFADGVLTIRPPAGDKLLTGALSRETNRTLLGEVLQEIWGAGSRFVVGPPGAPVEPTAAPPVPAPLPRPAATAKTGAAAATADAPPPAPTPAAGRAELDAARQQPVVQAVLELFGGEIEGVQPGNKES